MKKTYPYYLANEAKQPNEDLEVTNKYNGETAFRVALADEASISEAIRLACDAEEKMKQLRPFERRDILEHCVKRFEEKFEELAESLCIEAGKPIKDSRGEVKRLITTFKVAAEEATRIGGDVLNLEISKESKGYRGFTKKVPIGVCSFISPFNFPLNLTAHKIAPAIAAGCPFILKPASRTPIGALMIGEILAETELPKGAFSILPCKREDAGAFTTDERLKLLSFTGSPDIGWELKSKAGKKKVILELGGNAACIVDEGTDIEKAVDRIITGAFYQSGQSCISVQRIIIHESIYGEFKEALIQKTKKLKMGNPLDDDTFIGPVISKSDGDRLKEWIQEALDSGAKVLCGGEREGSMVEATLLEDVSKDCRVYKEEAFGPVAVLSKFDDFDEAIKEVNNSRYGLQVGIFTHHISKAMQAWDDIVVGGVVIGDVPSWRVDNMPYGGVKDSGLGREGLRYSIEDMTEERLLIIKD